MQPLIHRKFEIGKLLKVKTRSTDHSPLVALVSLRITTDIVQRAHVASDLQYAARAKCGDYTYALQRVIPRVDCCQGV
jgi:hypothetical protein